MEELLRLTGYCMGVAALFCFALAWFTWPKRPSPELREFLSDWYEWATAGAPEQRPFSRADGLCVALIRHKNYNKIRAELKELLWDDFQEMAYPFGRDSYKARWKHRTQHQCPKRLAWVADKIGA